MMLTSAPSVLNSRHLSRGFFHKHPYILYNQWIYNSINLYSITISVSHRAAQQRFPPVRYQHRARWRFCSSGPRGGAPGRRTSPLPERIQTADITDWHLLQVISWHNIGWKRIDSFLHPLTHRVPHNGGHAPSSPVLSQSDAAFGEPELSRWRV